MKNEARRLVSSRVAGLATQMELYHFRKKVHNVREYSQSKSLSSRASSKSDLARFVVMPQVWPEKGPLEIDTDF